MRDWGGEKENNKERKRVGLWRSVRKKERGRLMKYQWFYSTNSNSNANQKISLLEYPFIRGVGCQVCGAWPLEVSNSLLWEGHLWETEERVCLCQDILGTHHPLSLPSPSAPLPLCHPLFPHSPLPSSSPLPFSPNLSSLPLRPLPILYLQRHNIG